MGLSLQLINSRRCLCVQGVGLCRGWVGSRTKRSNEQVREPLAPAPAAGTQPCPVHFTHHPLVRAILSELCADMLLCGAGGSLPLRRPASAVRMAGKRSSSFNLARLVDDGPYPVEGSEHNADLVRTFPT